MKKIVVRHLANGAAGLQVNKRSRDFSPVTELYRTFAQAAAGYDGDCIGGATIDLDKCNQAFAVFLRAARIFDS